MKKRLVFAKAREETDFSRWAVMDMKWFYEQCGGDFIEMWFRNSAV